MKDPKRPVSLEDLLRLKRAEQPPAEFWSEFDRQLRAKQLAALVEKRPWWHGLQQSFLRVGRYHVAFGTAAVVAFVFVSNRDRLFSAAQPTVNPEVSSATTETHARVQQGQGSASRTAAAQASNGTDESAVVTSDNAPGVSTSSFQDRNNETAVNVPVTSRGLARAGTFVPDSERAEVSDSLSPVEAITGASIEPTPAKPSARFIAANFAAAQATQESAAAQLLGGAHGFEARGLPARVGTTVDPLQNMAPPGEPRRSTRFLAAMVSMSSDDAAGRTTERMANRISQEELYDQVRRFGTRHGGFNMKF